MMRMRMSSYLEEEEDELLEEAAFSAVIKSFLFDSVMKARENCPALACCPAPEPNKK
jgi:hypothetical protein